MTATQLSRLGTSSGQSLSLAHWLEAFANASRLPENKRDEALRAGCESMVALLSLNETDAAILENTLISGVLRVVELEQTSLPVRETKPGTLVLDFDALAEDRRKILDDMRADLRRDLGGSLLNDLDVLLGFDSFTESPGPSQNCEISISRKDGQWHVMAIAPDRVDPAAGMMETADFPGDWSEKEAFQAAIKRGASRRYGHVGGALPSNLSPVP